MSAESMGACGVTWPKPKITSPRTGKPLKRAPWSCNRPDGHPGDHQVIDRATFKVKAAVAR